MTPQMEPSSSLREMIIPGFIIIKQAFFEEEFSVVATSPPMGTGRLAEAHFGKAAYIRQLKIVDKFQHKKIISTCG
ncbi:hypothetical protein Patl1_17706 [Pistacia atlantica]|uniref:Uncharacterized protein n=1 Tax=Pistacia atlantica TaxID=434234 RepID=A0ACC1BZ66_9ROSI|nr:hypothetical protein Patl1_17706 [Pistacia atlantica]